MLIDGSANSPQLEPLYKSLVSIEVSMAAHKVWQQATDDYLKCIYVNMLGHIEAVIAHQGGHIELLESSHTCICYFLLNK